MSQFYVPPSPRGRAYSVGQAVSYPYQSTPYSNYNALPAPYYGTPGVARSGTFYVAPSVAGRSRSHSRPRRSHSHHHSHHGHHHHSHRRSHSATPRHHRPSTNHIYRYQSGATTSPRSNYYRSSPSLGERILSFFGLGGGSRYVDQYGRSIDSRGRPKYK